MDKTIKRILFLYVIVGFLIVIFFLLFKFSYGPKNKTFKVKISDEIELYCEETYNGDNGGEYYDVDFFIQNENEKIFIGKATFYNDKWEEDFYTDYEIDDWNIVVVFNGENDRVFAVNIKNKKLVEIERHLLKENNNWIYFSNIKLPSSLIYEQINLDTIIEDRFYVNYQYRLGFNEPFEYYSQIIEYEFSQKTGKLVYKKANPKQEITE